MNVSARFVCATLLHAGLISLAIADETSESIDEITVLGVRDLGALRAEITRAEDEVYDVYNDLNDNDDYDIICKLRAPIGSQIKQREYEKTRQRESRAGGRVKKTLRPAAEIRSGTAKEIW